MTGRRPPWAAVAVAIAPVACFLVRNLLSVGDDAMSGGDYAVLEASTRSASEFEQFLGPYSRFFWHQPGPLLFYWLAPLYRLAGQQLGGLAAATVLLNLLGLAGIVLLVDRMAGRAAAWGATVGVALFTWSYGVEQFGDVWNPATTVVPLALTVLLAAALAAGWRWALPWCALTASFAVQAHLSTAPTLVAVLATAVVVATWRERHAIRQFLWPGVATAIVLYDAWILPLFEQATKPASNLGTLLRFFLENRQPPHSARESLISVLEVLAPTRREVGIVIRSSAFSGGTDLRLRHVGVAVLVGGLILVAWTAARRRRPFSAAAASLPLLGLATCLVSAREVAGALFLYVLVFVSGVTLATLVGVFAGAAELWADRLPRHVAVALTVGALSILVPVNLRDGLSERRLTTREHHPGVADVVPPILSRVGNQSSVRLEVLDHDQWPVMTGVLNQLERRGVDVAVEDGWLFMVGDQRRSDGREPVVFRFAQPTRPPDGRCVVVVTQYHAVFGGSGRCR